jgi:hypothetical protein
MMSRSPYPPKRILFPCVLALVSLCACSPAVIDETLGVGNGEYDKPVLDAPPAMGKDDSISGVLGPPEESSASDTRVWATPNRWTDRSTPAAREAGLAWDEYSGLDWNEKYALWIASMNKIPRDNGYGSTFELTTPWGVRLPSPALECAEASVFLRVTFASWYGLPFYISAWTPTGSWYFGHFGIWTDHGPVPNFPTFATRYEDFTDVALDEDLGNWPVDSKLAKRKISVRGDDRNPWLGENAYAGAYFDRIFLNKRTGHFMVYILTYTGSMHLASSTNTFNLVPTAVREGDTLLKRWQKKGIGHTMVVKSVDRMPDGEHLEVEIMSGSMPRRQPVWDNSGASKSAFTNHYAGGEGMSSHGHSYAELGGGIKRWRVAVVHNGRWRNEVAENDAHFYIPSTDLNAVSARPGQFESLLVQLSPEEKVQMLLELIESKRQHLREYPASCSARIVREDAFDELAEVSQREMGMDREWVDNQYRTLEDYVFGELLYEHSRTCCWNSSTNAMYHIIMGLNHEIQDAAETNGECVSPTIFKMVDGEYRVFWDYALEHGLGDMWNPWSEDEECPQGSSVLTDIEVVRDWTAFCPIP